MIHINRVAFTTVAIILLAGTFLLNLASCGPVKGYAGDTRPAADVATLRANPFWSDILVTVTAVDGFEVNSQIDLSLLPGERTLTIELGPCSMQSMNQAGRQTRQMLGMTNAEWRTRTTVTASFEAGIEYAISGDWTQPEYSLEVQRYDDRSAITSKTVTGTKGQF